MWERKPIVGMRTYNGSLFQMPKMKMSFSQANLKFYAMSILDLS